MLHAEHFFGMRTLTTLNQGLLAGKTCVLVRRRVLLVFKTWKCGTLSLLANSHGMFIICQSHCGFDGFMVFIPKELIGYDLIPPTASWFLRKICKARDTLSHWVMKDNYRSADVYKEYAQHNTPVAWAKFVWHRPSIPKESLFFGLLSKTNLRLEIDFSSLVLLMMLVAPCASLQLRPWNTFSLNVCSALLYCCLIELVRCPSA